MTDTRDDRGGQERFQVGNWTVDPASGSLVSGDDRRRLEPRVMEVLVYLARHPGEVIAKDELVQGVWADTFVTEAALSRCISELRRNLGDDARQPSYIETLPKRGYRLVAPVRQATGAESAATVADDTEAATGRADPGSALGPRARLNMFVAASIVALLFAAWWFGGTAPDLDAPVRSIAVLPLRALSDEPGAANLAEGLTEQLLTRLAGVEGLSVVSGISARPYREADEPLPQIAARLGVDALVDGTVQMSGGRVLVSLELLHGRRDVHLWAGSYQEIDEEPLQIQQEVAEAAVREIALVIAGDATVPDQPVDPEVAREVRRALRLAERGLPADALRASEILTTALERDPDYAMGHAHLADLLADMAWSGWADAEAAYAAARTAAYRGLDLQPRLAPAHAVLAAIAAENNWDWPEADRKFRTAIELDPASAFARERYARMLRRLGRYQEALAQTQRAVQLDPESLEMQASYSWSLLLDGQLEAAITGFASVLELEDDFAPAAEGLCAALTLRQAGGAAVAACERAAALPGHENLRGALAWALAHAGERSRARQLVEEMSREYEGRPLGDIGLAVGWLGLDERDLAIAALRRAIEARVRQASAVLANPYLRQLAGDPAFDALLVRLAIEPGDA